MIDAQGYEAVSLWSKRFVREDRHSLLLSCKLLLFHAVVDSTAFLVDYRYLLCEVALLQCLHWWNFCVENVPMCMNGNVVKDAPMSYKKASRGHE